MANKPVALFSFLAVCGIAAASFSAEGLRELEAAYLRGEYETVAQKAATQLRGGVGRPDELLYLRGMAALQLRDWDLAWDSLQRLVQEHPKSAWAPHAWLALGDSAASSGNFEAALKVYEKAVSEGGAGPLVPQVYLEMGKIQRHLGLWDPARGSFERVVREAPESQESATAREILKAGDFFFTVQVGSFAGQPNAQRLQAELRRRGYPADLQEVESQGRIFHRVRVGQFRRREEAEDQARTLQKDGFPAKLFP